MHEESDKKESMSGKKRKASTAERPMGNKTAKRIAESEKITEVVMSKLGVTQNATTPSSGGSTIMAPGVSEEFGKALTRFAYAAGNGMDAYARSVNYAHGDEDMKRRLANAKMNLDIVELEKETLLAKKFIRDHQLPPPEEVVVTGSANDTGTDAVPSPSVAPLDENDNDNGYFTDS